MRAVAACQYGILTTVAPDLRWKHQIKENPLLINETVCQSVLFDGHDSDLRGRNQVRSNEADAYFWVLHDHLVIPREQTSVSRNELSRYLEKLAFCFLEMTRSINPLSRALQSVQHGAPSILILSYLSSDKEKRPPKKAFLNGRNLKKGSRGGTLIQDMV